MIDTILDPQIWLVLVALTHAVVGVIIPTDWEDDTSKLVSGFFLLTTVTMLYTAFMMEGEEMARMAVVIAGPVWVWFVIACAALNVLGIRGCPMRGGFFPGRSALVAV